MPAGSRHAGAPVPTRIHPPPISATRRSRRRCRRASQHGPRDMANALYPKTKAAMMQGGVNLITSTVKALLVDLDDYTYDAAHDFLNDVPTVARVSISPALSAKT